MKVDIAVPELARFALLSLVSALLALLIGMSPIGGLSLDDVLNNAWLIVIIWLTWTIVVAFARGWIRFSGDS